MGHTRPGEVVERLWATLTTLQGGMDDYGGLVNKTKYHNHGLKKWITIIGPGCLGSSQTPTVVC
jgi:hypothetical protein